MNAELKTQDFGKTAKEAVPASMPLDAFKENVWLPELKANLRSWKLYARVYEQYLKDIVKEWRNEGEFREDLEFLTQELRARKLSGGAYNRVLSVLKNFMKSAHEHGLIGQNFGKEIKSFLVQEKNRRQTCLEAEKVRTLFEALSSDNARLARAIELLLLTGASKSEILAARWEDFDSERQSLKVLGRNGRHRILRLGPRAMDILASLENTRTSDWVFPGRDPGKPAADVFFVWDKIRKSCGMNSIRIQDLGHNYKNWQKNNTGYSAALEGNLECVHQEFHQKPILSKRDAIKNAILGMATSKTMPTKVEGSKSCSSLEHFLEFMQMIGNEIINGKKEKYRIDLYVDLANTALRKAGLDRKEIQKSRCALYLGIENSLEELLESHLVRSEACGDRSIAQNVGARLGLTGDCLEIIAPGNSFSIALKEAAFGIYGGRCEIALAGGISHKHEDLGYGLGNHVGPVMAVVCGTGHAKEMGKKIISIISI